MSCTTCRNKACRTQARDCFDVKAPSLEAYAAPQTRQIALAASRLIDNGRAGTLDRLEEIIEYCRDMGYSRVGVAYCFGFPELAERLQSRLKQAGLTPIMVQCTAGGVREREIDESKTKDTVSCNPAGQARVLEKRGAQFVIEMGLCMGHDVILHQELEVPFTTFLVKDRVHDHHPARTLGSVADPMARFLEEMDDSFRMIPGHKLRAWLGEDEPDRPVVLDLRAAEAYANGHIPGSIRAPLRALPKLIKEILPDKKRRIVCVCQGSVQSAYAVAFLYERGYRNAYNLSGGFSRWQSDGHPVDSTRVASGAAASA